MGHKSESQWKPIGTCPDCGSELYLMGNKIKWHDCPYDRMDSLVISINKLAGQVKRMDRKTPADIIRGFYDRS